jgi:hypothetical protein
MSLQFNHTSSKNLQLIKSSSGLSSIEISKEILPQFVGLINRALNCFPDAHPELKELGDLLTEGKVLQDYSSQK